MAREFDIISQRHVNSEIIVTEHVAAEILNLKHIPNRMSITLAEPNYSLHIHFEYFFATHVCSE